MIDLGTIQLPKEAATKTFAILAKKGAGKSYTAGVMEEEFYKNGIPFVVFDPIDVHWGIRFNKDEKTPGFPVVVFGVLENADITLTEDMGKQIAQAVVTKNISCILSTFGMSKKGQRKLITDFSEELLRINNTPRHIFIEEAHEFVPQRITSDLGRCFAAVEALVVMGRNRGLGVTLINQRAATINKDVLTQIDTLLAFRNVAPQDRKALQEWVEVHASEEDFEAFWKSLPSLPTGEGWIWSPEWLGEFKQIKVRERETLHPDREKLTGVVEFPNLEQSDIQNFIDEFKSQKFSKEEVIKQSEKIDKRTERATISVQEEIHQVSESFKGIIEDKDKEIEELKRQLKEANFKLKNIEAIIKGETFEVKGMIGVDKSIGQDAAYYMWINKLPGGATKILQVLKDKYPMKFTRSNLAVLTGIRLSTLSRGTGYLLTLKQNNLIKEEGGFIMINEDIL